MKFTPVFFYLLVLVVSLHGCGGGGDGFPTSNNTNILLNGTSQKGPLILGSSVEILALDINLAPTGDRYTTQVNNDFGEFTFEGAISSPYIEIIVDGFFFDELTGLLSGSRIELRSIAEVSSNIDVKVNLLTTLQTSRLKYLINNGSTFESARSQSISDVLTLFNISSDGISDFTMMDISGSTESDAILLATSVILMQMADDLSTSETEKVARLALLLSQLRTDLEIDGEIDPFSSNYQQLIISSQNTDLIAIRNNLLSIYT